MNALVRNSILRRNVFNPRNSSCGSAPIADLSSHWWWTDNSDPDSLYIHACRWSDRTYHRVWPRPIPGYTCKRIEMKNRVHGAKLFWLYDANRGTPPTERAPGQNAPARRAERTE
jgi:hypothetical protein